MIRNGKKKELHDVNERLNDSYRSMAEKDAQINEEIDEMRHAATADLIEYKDTIIVASVSCIYGIGEVEEYKNKMLKFVTKEEFMKVKEQCDEALLKVCPKGKCYMVLEYECDSDVALNFYATSYLDSEIEIGSENAVSTIFMHFLTNFKKIIDLNLNFFSKF